MQQNSRRNKARTIRGGIGVARRCIAAGLVICGTIAVAGDVRAQNAVMPYPAMGGYPMMGMMTGGCLAMGWGGPMMMGPVTIIGSGMMSPGMMVPGTISPGMMSWSNDYGGSSFAYQSMMGGSRVMQNSVVTGNVTPQGMGPQMMAGNAALIKPRPEAVLEGRLAYLRTELGITDDQQAAWDVYATALRARLGHLQEIYQRQSNAVTQGDAVARLDARIEAMEQMLEGLKAIRPAVDGLYKTLNNDQKRLADQLLAADCNGM